MAQEKYYEEQQPQQFDQRREAENQISKDLVRDLHPRANESHHKSYYNNPNR